MKKTYRWVAVFSLIGWLLGSGPVAAQVLWSKLGSSPARLETGKFMTAVGGGFVMVGDAATQSTVKVNVMSVTPS
ncbi:hypothetical protein [Hymenobacter siberiensis]|jgi:hypothetical protein|uniref:hypothetical protein n=1 Tax=Hymenobacter siberiensis TaxID=2848396 RepID=UPI001C1E3847|nr:hypothetical protein [Hymenobacter siberiensis]